MNTDLRYLGKSGVREGTKGSLLVLSPNLAREKVSFDGEVRDPVRFREAMSTLHEVVIGDLKFRAKDKSAYLAWKEGEAERDSDKRRLYTDQARHAELERLAKEPLPPNLEADFRRLHREYWAARTTWSNELAKNDPALFRALVPWDPVITVAPDVVFFECFAKDESAYGCLTVERDAFVTEEAPLLGTTNVDYSLALFDHFQTLRSYRPTRLRVDPSGFEVNVDRATLVREEKIDLPTSWLRGFGQLQAAMLVPSRRVVLSTDVVYSILAYLKRHREKTGPRSLTFRLEPGKPVQVVMEPWGVVLTSRARPYDGPKPLEIKVWGRRRLLALSRILPLTTHVEVSLLGSGLPSVWVAHMGDMHFTLALSGWTANDWTKGTNLDQHFGNVRADSAIVASLVRVLEVERSGSFAFLCSKVGGEESVVAGSLLELAKRGQVAYDFVAKKVRYRPILPSSDLLQHLLRDESHELAASRELTVKITRDETIGTDKRLVVGETGETTCEAIIDSDWRFSRAKCKCSFFFRNRLRSGPCRHLIALRRHLCP